MANLQHVCMSTCLHILEDYTGKKLFDFRTIQCCQGYNVIGYNGIDLFCNVS